MPDEQLKYGNVIQIGPITIEVRGNNEKRLSKGLHQSSRQLLKKHW